MHEVADIYNLIGIILEIIGFLVLLSAFKNWIYYKTTKIGTKPKAKYDPLENNPSKEEKINIVNSFIDYIKHNEKLIILRQVDIVGIWLVVSGLVIQGISVILHS